MQQVVHLSLQQLFQVWRLRMTLLACPVLVLLAQPA
jgi:hypothetical protein